MKAVLYQVVNASSKHVTLFPVELRLSSLLSVTDRSVLFANDIRISYRVAKKMRTYFEMGTDGHRFLCFQFGIS